MKSTKKKIVWPEGREAFGREMVEKSYRALQNYWDKYDDLENNYIRVQRENDRLNRSLERNKKYNEYVYRLTSGFLIIVYIVLLVFAGGLLLR